ncbi:DUF559 domain-containing protein [Adlercreutzia equolifaciens]|uniref:DUF559 domain-containing protein n=1 Tax=Adlercreutzia equolifaciens TaxID=446660 RepID=UPI0023B0D5A9|nr:DUF559 domain-containing protein [Adlercreutzia equolifaciens]MDE8701436.1 DUF559 domain-containing protein [Adlercreutzia equolifaciens]
MSKLLLFGSSALIYYDHCRSLPRVSVSGPDLAAADFAPTAAMVRYALRAVPSLAVPLHVSVFAEHERRQKVARCHVAPTSVRDASFGRVAEGLFVPSPGLALAQYGRGRTLPDMVLRGMALCSCYALDEQDCLVERIPLTDPSALERATRLHRDVPGCRLAREALPWMVSGAASPREAALAAILALPPRYGGYGFPKPKLNARIDLPRKAQGLADTAYYVADFLWEEQRVVLEYDSDAFHLTSERHHHDTVRRGVLESLGYRVIGVTRMQLNVRGEMDKVAVVLSRALKRPLRIRAQRFRSQQAELWRIAGLGASSQWQ